MKKAKLQEDDDFTFEENILRDIFSKTKMQFINENFLEFIYDDISFMWYNELGNNLTFEIDFIYNEFKNHGLYESMTSKEISVIIEKLMLERFKIGNLNSIFAE